MSTGGIPKIEKGDTVSFVGAGGKTLLISFLALELRREFSVAVTTTTRMFPLDSYNFNNVFGAVNDYGRFAGDARGSGKVPAFFGGRDSDGKCLPPAEEELAHLAKAFDVLLIEADGARGKSLKRPRENEPVVPGFSKKIVWVTGADALGKRFSDDLVFKPETFEAAGFQLEQEIDFRNLRRALYAPGGYLDKLADRRIYLVINKADAIEGFDRESVRLLWHPRLSGLAISGLEGKRRFFEEITNRENPVAAVVLAAGASERFGSQKLLGEYDGSPLVCRGIRAAIEGGADNVITVIPENSPALRNAIESRGMVEIVENPDARNGISTSIKAGLQTISKGRRMAMMLMLADMPNVDAALVKEVLSAFRGSGAPICAPYEDGRFGHPVVFHPVMFDKIAEITGDTGCREILRGDPEMVKTIVPSKPGTQEDVDRPADIERTHSDGRVLQGIS